MPYGDLKMKTKTATIEQYLLGKINSGEFPPQKQIPSQFKLMQQFNCSRIIVQRALKNLINAGLLESDRGRGTFVRKDCRNQALKEIIVVSEFTDNSPDFPFSEMLFNLNTGNIPVRWVDQQFLDRNTESFFRPGHAVIWLLPKENQIMLMDNLKRRGIPQLLINRKYAKFNYICTDAASSISEGLDRIIADGEKKIALVSRLPNAGAAFIPERLIAFYEQCFIRNLQIPEKWIFKRDFKDMARDSAEMGQAFFSDKSNFPKNIFIPQEDLLTSVLLTASHHGLTLGKDYRILVFSQGLVHPPQEGLYMLYQPMDEFRSKVEEFIRRVTDGDDTPFCIPLKTILRTN